MKTNRDILAKFISTEGYKRNSPDVNNPINIIPSGNISMQDVDFPVYGVDNLGNEQLMMPGAEYTFPGDYVVETPMAQTGGTRPPIFTSNPNDPRIQNYSDSLNLYNYSKKLSRLFPKLPEVTEQQYKQLQEKDNNLLNYEFDEVAYKKDKKEGTVKNFDDYIYSGKQSEIYSTPQYLKNNQKELDKYSNDDTGKYDVQLPNGTIKSPGYLYNGKPQWDMYSIWNPNTKTFSHYSKNIITGKDELSHVSSDNIKPVAAKYYGEDKIEKAGVISTSSKSTGWYKKGDKPVFKTDSKKEYVDTYIPFEKVDVYKKPVQPVIYKKQKLANNITPVETTTTVTPTITPEKPTPTPVVERKVVSVSPEEVKAGIKTTSGKQIGSGTAGGRIYRVKYDNGETEILNEFEYRSRGLKKQDGGQTGWLDEYQEGGQQQMYPGPSLQFQQQVQNFVNKTPNTFVRREPVTVSQSDNTRTNAVEDAKRTVESYSKEDIKYFLDNNIPKERWGIEKVKMQDQAVLRAREAARNQSREDVKNNPFAITKATNENLRNEFRAFPNDPNSFFDEYLNPAQMIGNLAANLGDNFTGEQPIDPWKVATDVVTPAFVGMTAGIGAQNTGQFANNLINPLAGIRNPLARRPSNIRTSTSQLPPPPAQIRIDPDLGMNDPFLKKVDAELRAADDYYMYQYNQIMKKQLDPDLLEASQLNRTRNANRFMTSGASDQLPSPPSELFWNDFIQTNRPSWANQSWAKPKAVNKSGLTLEETLEKVAAKDKDTVSKMSDAEFENTVLKPDGQLVKYEADPLIKQMRYDSNSGRNVLKDQTVLSREEYADIFNSQLDLLNSIIKRRNKSGVEYRVKGLNPDTGTLQFETPPQTIPSNISPRTQQRIDRFYSNPEEFLKNEAGLYQDGNIWRFPDEVGGDVFNSIEEAVQFTKKELEDIAKPTTISGESTWGVRVNPGKWRGDVEDLPNTEYLRSIPGIEMSNTTAGVFSDRVARKGTGAYESINEYLKTLDLGRVKPGFNSQTDYSRGAWENFIKSGRGVGFYANPRTVYGTMKTLAPIGVGVGVGASLNTRKTGGQTNWLDEYE